MKQVDKMKKIYRILFFVLAVITLCSCSENEDNTPSMADKDRLDSLLDKSNADVFNFEQKYGTYILYRFDTLLDFAYQFEEASNWRTAKVTMLEQADEAGAVTFLKNNFLNRYSDEVLTTYFPRKLLICSRVYGLTLGVSTVKSESTAEYHQAVANLNSMTVANLDARTLNDLATADKTAFVRQIHYIYLAGYLISSRGYHDFVNETFFNYNATDYKSLIDPSRKPVSAFDDETFYKKGFFRPEDESATYYGSSEEDLIAYVKNLVLMDEGVHDVVMAHSLMKSKMELVARSLKAFGVDIEGINPLSKDFL